MLNEWLIFGILAAVFWGTYIVVAKTTNIPQPLFLLLMGIAIFFTMTAYWLISGAEIAFSIDWEHIAPLLSGCLWALGMIVAVLAISKGADISKLVPIYNTNTLIAVFIGILFLHEIPNDWFKVVSGAVLIVIGAVLVSI